MKTIKSLFKEIKLTVEKWRLRRRLRKIMHAGRQEKGETQDRPGEDREL